MSKNKTADGYKKVILLQYKGPAQDAGLLGEMIFGAVAMNYRGVSLKIHIMDEPQRYVVYAKFWSYLILVSKLNTLDIIFIF